jgi:pimeloyl-ACP methyl ester carboxylesterase
MHVGRQRKLAQSDRHCVPPGPHAAKGLTPRVATSLLAVLRITMSTYVHDTTHTKACGFFLSEGVRCGTTLRRPAGASATDRLPVVLMIHGWGGVQASLIPPFYEAFLRQGLAVMTFDFRGWGASDGWPRQVIRVKDRLADVEAALAHLKTCPGIDDRRIVLWGTSLGGGHAITVGSHHPELLGIVAQVPMLDGRAAAMITPWRRKLRFAAWALADWLKPGKQPIYVPTVSAPGVFGTTPMPPGSEALSSMVSMWTTKSLPAPC